VLFACGSIASLLCAVAFKVLQYQGEGDNLVVASFYIRNNKSLSTESSQLKASRNYHTSFYEKDFPVFFVDSNGRHARRGLTKCRFYREDKLSIDYECQSRAKVREGEVFPKATAYLYRISINGYPRKESRLYLRLSGKIDQSAKDRLPGSFFDPINHPVEGSPELQSLTVQARTFSANSPELSLFAYENIGRSAFVTVLASCLLGLVLALALVKRKNYNILLGFAVFAVCYLAVEYVSRSLYWDPLPRGALQANSVFLGILDNVRLGLSHRSVTGGRQGEDLVDFVWKQGYRENYPDSNVDVSRVHSFAKDVNGISYSNTCGSRNDNPLDVLVIGASVAEGAHASLIAKTWWNLAADQLSELSGKTICIGVFAVGGIRSDSELNNFRKFLLFNKAPKVLIVVHGQNDIINETLNLESKPVGAGKDFREKSRKAVERAIVYSEGIRSLAAEYGVSTYEVVPPSALDKVPLTSLEKSILVGYAGEDLYDWSLPARMLNHEFDRFASARVLSDHLHQRFIFLDLRNIFNAVPTTLFADIWHFGDKGHELLAHYVSSAVSQEFTR